MLQLDAYREFTARPERLRDLVAAMSGNRVVILDEIQKVPSLLNEVHSQMEKDKKPLFVLTGSSTRPIRRKPYGLTYPFI